MTSKFKWPDRRDFSHVFGTVPADRSLKQVREFKTVLPGTIARVVEFHHDFQSRPYVESRTEKKSRRNSADLGTLMTAIGNLIVRR